MKKMKSLSTKNIARLGVFIALALVLSYVESLIPFSFGIPGIKLGLTNIVTVIILYTCGGKEAAGISVIRAVLAGFMFGNGFSIIYSLAGCILSFICMYILKRTDKFAIMSISVAGGVMHNIGQLVVAAFVVETYSIVYYIPVLLAAGTITGMIIGLISQEIVIRIGDRFMAINK